MDSSDTDGASGRPQHTQTAGVAMRHPPSLERIVSRFNVSSEGQESASQPRAPAPRTGRLELAGRMGNASEDTTIQRSPSPSKSRVRAMPSLDDIRVRLAKKNAGEQSSAENSPSGSPALVSESPNTGTDTADADSPAPTPQENSAQIQDTVTGDAAASPVVGGAAGAAAKAGKTVHPMQHTWTLYYDCQRFHGVASSDQYEATLKRIGEFNTLESFFETFATLHRPSRLEKNANYHIFKDDVKPMWEDPSNVNGGRWVLTLRDTSNTPGGAALHEALLNRSWLWLVLGLIGEEFDPENLLTGAVCSIRGKGDRITLWLRIKEPVEKVNALGERLLDFLELKDESGLQLEFGTNSGGKDTRYMHVRNGARQGDKSALGTPQGPLGAWLGKDITLHPYDHARVVAMREAKAEDSGAGAI